jgi:hypothetical protein
MERCSFTAASLAQLLSSPCWRGLEVLRLRDSDVRAAGAAGGGGGGGGGLREALGRLTALQEVALTAAWLDAGAAEGVLAALAGRAVRLAACLRDCAPDVAGVWERASGGDAAGEDLVM